MVYVIFLCITLPLLLMLPILDQRARRLVVFLLLGAVIAVSAYEVNTLLYPLAGLPPRAFTQVIPPVVEELLKAAPVFVYAVFLENDRKLVLPVAMAVGVGFAIVENTVILVQNIEAVTLGWAALRGFSASLMHGLCTMAVGAGVTYVHKHKKLFYTGIFGLLSMAITMHALFNLLIESSCDILGMAMPLALYGLLYLARKRSTLRLPFLSY